MKFRLKHLLSNALKNFAPAAFLVPGVGPGLAAAIGGAGSALGQGLSRHPNLGAALKAGVAGAGEGYTGAKLAGGQGYKGVISGVKSAFVPSSSASATAGSPSSAYLSGHGVTGAAPTSLLPGGGGGVGPSSSGLGGSLGSALPASQIGSTVSAGLDGSNAAPSFLGRVGAFAEKNPTLAAGFVSGLGSMGTRDAEAEEHRAIARRTTVEADTLESERKRKAAQDAALEPLRRALAGQLGNFNSNQYKPAPNPYYSGVGAATNPYSS